MLDMFYMRQSAEGDNSGVKSTAVLNLDRITKIICCHLKDNKLYYKKMCVCFNVEYLS